LPRNYRNKETGEECSIEWDGVIDKHDGRRMVLYICGKSIFVMERGEFYTRFEAVDLDDSVCFACGRPEGDRKIHLLREVCCDKCGNMRRSFIFY
jgi:DNA-directed RNA polymerase subunit RPC12/RpoP